MAVRVGGTLDVAALRRAVTAVTARHPALHDLEFAESDVRETANPRRAASDAARRASRRPGARLLAVHVAHDEHLLVLTASGVDVASLWAVLRESSAAYPTGEPGPRAETPAPQRLRDADRSDPDLPADFPRRPGGRTAVVRVPAPATRDPADLLSALGVVLARHTGQDAVRVGTAVDTRPPGAENAVGDHTITATTAVDLSDRPTFRDLVARTSVSPDDTPVRARLTVVPPPPELFGRRVDTVAVVDDGDWDLDIRVADEVEVVYRPDRHHVDRITDLVAQIRRVLDQDPDLPVTSYPLGTDVPRPVPPTAAHTGFPARFAEHASATPDRTAVEWGRFSWSYREVARESDGIAARLASAGVGVGDVVAVHAARLPVLVPALLGIGKAGAAFAVLDATHPPARTAELARAAGATRWIDAAPGRAAPFADEPVLRLVGLHAGEHAEPPAIPYDPHRTAYLAFTSGTTGTPRVVAGTGAVLDHFLSWYTEAHGLDGDDRVTVLSGLGHDPFLRDVLIPLWTGGTAVFPDVDPRDTDALAGWLGRSRATVTHLTPALGAALAAARPANSVRLIGFGGEALRESTVREWAALAPDAVQLNLYGATETPQVVSAHDARTTTSASGRAPIGPGSGGTQVLVLAGDRPAAVGELGEIAVRGRHLGRYADDQGPGGFVEDPFAPTETGADRVRLYRTGDLGRRRPDGLIDLAGRADDQVKVRGHRVSPAEVEAVLAAHPEVTGALVAGRVDGTGATRLVAWVTGAVTADLRAFAAATLPDHAVPAAIAVLEAFPLTARGKLDRAGLPEPTARTTRHDPPRTDAETRIARLWQDLLDLPTPPGRADDFFALGGHSLVLARLLARLRAGFGLEVDLADLFRHRTVEAQAALLPDVPAPPPTAIPRGAPGLLSWTQERLWFEHRLDPTSTAYHMTPLVRLRGHLDVAALREAFRAVVREHDALRTAFPDGATPTQVVAAEADPVFTVHDLRAAPDTADAHIAEEVRTPFDLGTPPLLRVRLLRLADDEHLLVVVVHHIVFDGWSIGLLLRDLGRAHRPALGFPDAARWERAEVDGPALDALLDRWERRLAGVPTVLDLPTDLPRPAVRRSRGARHRITVDAATSAGVRALARRHDTTVFAVLLSAFSAVLARWTGRRDLLVGTPVANRPRPEFEDVIGPFVNTLPLRVDLTGRPAFGELVRRVGEDVLEDLAHQQVPFAPLRNRLAPDRDLSRNPLVQVLFALQNTPVRPPDLPGVTAELVHAAEATAQFDLALRVTDTGAEIHGWLDYDTDLFEDATAHRFADQFAAVLRADPATPVDEVDLPGADLVLTDWNDTAVEFPPTTLRALLAPSTSDSTALWWRGAAVTHAELHARAGRLAHELRAHGVGPDAVVAVHLERSPELVVALLAVLRAGGAYLPLDPGYPQDRLRHMLSDSGARVLLTAGGLETDVPRVLVDEHTGTTGPTYEGDPGTGPDHLAYLIYTSGSTGRPKGVQVTHRGIVNRLRWMRDDYRVTPADRILHKTPTSFDVSVWELFLPLVTGAVLVLAEPGGHRDPSYLAGLIRDAGVTIAHFVPPMLVSFLDATEPVPGLRLVVCSGEALPAETVRRFHAAHPGVVLENLYGPTEAAVDVTAYTTVPGRVPPSVPIGRPVANTRTLVLDHDYRVTPVGVPGELYLGGVQLARGYGGRPGLTADRFVPDPYGAVFGEPGSRLYRTGDLARWTAAGVLEFLGRDDHQVKLRGFRIELGEVEAALAALDGVGHAVAVVREDRPGDRRLVGYATGVGLDPVALRAELLRTLPEHLVPSAIVPLAVLPLNPSGKVDRAALPVPEATATSGEPPQTGEEQLLAGLWQQVLGVSRIGRDDDFFAVGGDSMHAVRVVGLARDHGFDLSLQDLFRARTLSAVAGLLTSTRTTATTTAAFGLLDPADLARLSG
ncbi:amino acid adenylation domain-containing protein [Actinosynnema sp. NPDC020468]|uniref:amino acid adenylation domain-containing protein n=1 Tax=Actinosynnema sp. NPDC020468 TaxID=3154488 RepID=UPI003410304E